MMNRSIQFIVCVLAILCQNINPAVAQTRSYDGVISVVPVQLEQRGKSVYINIDFVLEDVKVKSAHGVDFIPQLVAPAHTYNLPKVSIKGHNEYLAYERWLSLMWKRVARKEMIRFDTDIYCLTNRGWTMPGWTYSATNAAAAKFS